MGERRTRIGEPRTGRLRARLAVLAMTALVACGGSDAGGSLDDDPVLRPEDRAAPSKACEDQFVVSHDMEGAGTPTATAFLPSVQACSSLAEWTSVSRAEGVRLNGQEHRFVHSVCIEADAETRALPICREAELAARVR